MKTIETTQTSYLVALHKTCWIASFKDDTFLNSAEAKSFSDSSYEIAPFMSAATELTLENATRLKEVFIQKGFEHTAVVKKVKKLSYEYSMTTVSSSKKGKK